ncbi:MAG: S9 family peptidase [Synergistaceae bacterium]|nr:S9 family peptidase [Synergistaceae bacterium]
MMTQLRRVEHLDLMGYRFLSAPRFSPQGTKIAFAVHQADLEGDRYVTDIWTYDIEADRLARMTRAGAEGPFCWGRDGESLLIVSDRPPAAHEPRLGPDAPKMSRLYRLPVSGGEAELLAVLPRTVTGVWDAREGPLLQTIDPRRPERIADAKYRVFEEIPFCSNGKGFTAGRRTRLSLLGPGGTLEDLTPEGMDVGAVRLSDDGTRAVFPAVEHEDVMPLTRGVWEVDLRTRQLVPLLPQGRYAVGCAAPFAGGVLLTGTDMKNYGMNENMRFHMLRDGELTCLAPELDTSLHSSVVSDCRYGAATGEQFVVDGGRAWWATTEGYHSHLWTLDETGRAERVTSELRSVDAFDARGGRAAVVGLAGLTLQELWIVEGGTERRLTSFNVAALDGVGLSVPEHVHVENGTPEGLDGWYMRPVGFEVGRKYPTILHIHGGPKGTFSDVFVHEMQCWAAEGFVVIYCDPRGSDGRGSAFADIRGRYGTVDYEDIMTFVDWAVRTLPFVDGDRMGVTGGSYGGFMTNWIIGHTDRFRAAVTQRSICNWISMVGMSDIGYTFAPDQQAADIGEDVSALWDRSPLKWAAQVRTPTLIIHSDADHRCELGQGLQLFTALKRGGVECRMCVFEGEDHELSRSGRPKARLARLGEILRWMKDHV